VSASPTLRNPITITFPQIINNFGLDILNGLTSDVTYKLADNLGHSFTASVPPNLASGRTLAGFPAAGNVVTVSAVSGLPSWDYFIDNIKFNYGPNLPSFIPSSPPTLGSAVTLPGTDPNGPVVVITHGWEPTGTPLWVGTMAQSIQNAHPEVTVVEFIWPSAFTVNPIQADVSTKTNADALSSYLATLGDRPIQFIGHSFGTHVNAFAANALEQPGFQVKQFTILDRPYGVVQYADLAEQFLFSTLVGPSPIIDNYYGTLGFGAPLFDAVHNSEVPADHAGVHTYYEGTITDSTVMDGFQCSFIVGGNGCPDGIGTGLVLSLLSVEKIDFSTWNSIDAIVTASLAELIEQSPAYLWSNFSIPSTAKCMSFDYEWNNPGDGDYLTVTFGNDLLFNYVGKAFYGNGFLNSGCIPVGDLDGMTDQLLFALNSVGLPDADLLIRNLEFFDIAAASSVDESPVIGMTTFGIIVCATIARRRWRRDKMAKWPFWRPTRDNARFAV
jgi:pimeloyl-ACP methyl ester carboxylesterase